IKLDDISFDPDESDEYNSENKEKIFTDNINAVHNIKLDKIKIDIVCTLINPLEFIKTSFDLDCCQRSYNGKELYYPHDNIGNTQIVRISNVYYKYYYEFNSKEALKIINNLISTIDYNLLPYNIQEIYKRILENKSNDIYYFRLKRL